jgi:hypothetical protein
MSALPHRRPGAMALERSTRCAADWMHGLVAPRLVTTLVVLALVTTVGWMFL